MLLASVGKTENDKERAWAFAYGLAGSFVRVYGRDRHHSIALRSNISYSRAGKVMLNLSCGTTL